MKKMKYRICIRPSCKGKDINLTVLNEKSDPMLLICSNCGTVQESLPRVTYGA